MVQEEGKTQFFLDDKTTCEIMDDYGVGVFQARLMLAKRYYPEEKQLIQSLADKAKIEYQEKTKKEESFNEKIASIIREARVLDIEFEDSVDEFEESIIEGKLKYRGELYDR